MQTEYYSENRINCHAGNPSPKLEGLVGFPVSFRVTRVTGAGEGPAFDGPEKVKHAVWFLRGAHALALP